MGRLKNATLADLYKLRGRNAEAAARTAEVLMKHVQASVRDAASEAAFTAEKQSQVDRVSQSVAQLISFIM
jgi:hypothetical protein